VKVCINLFSNHCGDQNPVAHANNKVEAGQGIKPYPEYPLTDPKHANLRCKKIGGKIYYLGRLADPQNPGVEKFF
jgi:hypothetical protein